MLEKCHEIMVLQKLHHALCKAQFNDKLHSDTVNPSGQAEGVAYLLLHDRSGIAAMLRRTPHERVRGY